MQVLVVVYIGLCLLTIISYIKVERSYYIYVEVRNFLIPCLFLFFIFMVGLRDIAHPGDTKVYLSIFNYLQNVNFGELEREFRIELGFVYLVQFLGRLSGNDTYFMFSIAIIQSLLWFICFRLWVPNKYLLLSVLIFVSLFSSYNLGANTLRQGISLPIAFISLKYLFDQKIWKGLILILIASTFHKTSLLILIAWFSSRPSISIKYYFYAFYLVTLLSLLGLFTSIVNIVMGDMVSYDHLVREGAIERYRTGFRIDFWIFSFIPVMLYLFIGEMEKEKYSYIIKTYLFLFMLFIFAFEIPYSDRVGLYTWTMIPILTMLFHGKSRFKLVNSTATVCLFVAILGTLFFQFYPVMKLGVTFEDIM